MAVTRCALVLALSLGACSQTPKPVVTEPPPAHVLDDTPPHREPPPKKRIKVAARGVKLADDLLACIRQIESGGDYSTDTGNGYKGAYQFTESSWAANFGDREPSEVSPEEQDALAANYIARRGLSPWPTPSKRCG